MDDLKYFDNETPYFSLNKIKTHARVVNVVDGDTLDVVIPVFDKYYKFRSRINGIDTCEVHSNDVDIKNKGLQAKYRVIELLSKQDIKNVLCTTRKQIVELFTINLCIVLIECLEFDKYGRLLINVFINDDKSIADILIDEKLAYKYDGNKKLTEEQQKDFF